MGILYIVSTPIGNMEDITIRAVKTLLSARYIVCEDTRRTGLLLQELSRKCNILLHSNILFTPALVRFDEFTEMQKIPEIIQGLLQGFDYALVSDSGTPLISDPGYLLVRECIKRNIPVVSIPGPTALISALTVSGLPVDKFIFLGYPPEKSTHRIKQFNDLLNMNRFIYSTIIFYCAPHKLIQTLEDMSEVFGDIEIVIVRELTKIHEEVWRGKLSVALKYFVNPKGEFVILQSVITS